MPSIQERLQRNLSNRYAIDREIGRGGMATVFLAMDLKHEREVAVKVLHPELAATIGSDRFEREIKLAARLQHPHILGLYDSGETDNLLFYVMPFVHGESLRDRLDREGQLPIDDAIQITLEVADALGNAHAMGIIHRDIKPENILLSGGHALVADFGIAHAVTEGGGAKLTQTGMAVGTPVYMAPEQAMGETVGPTVDLYSLGGMLYEMLAGEPPFSAKSPQALMARHAMEAVPSVRIVRPTVPEEVEDAIFACMAKVPADRPQTAAQLAEMLGVPIGATANRRAIRATSSRRVPTQALTAAARPGGLRWRNPWVAAGITAFVVIGAWVGWRLVNGPTASRAAPPVAANSPIRRVAVLYFESLGDDPELAAAADGLTDALIRALGRVRAISVVSRNGVTPYRDGAVPRDSVARALRAGTLIEGTVEADGPQRVRVSTRLIDGTGADVGRRTSFVVARDQLFTAEDSVAREVSRTLREWVGEEIQLRERQASASSLAAWTLLNRAEQARKRSEAAADPAEARQLLATADSLLGAARAADPTWIDPVILQGEVALQSVSVEDPPARAAAVQRGQQAAQEALQLDPSSARALALRGTLTFTDWRLAGTADPTARAALLTSARQDLETATRDDPTLASAFAQLSFLYYADKQFDIYSALTAARQAYEADAYLSMADLILRRLFWASYDTDQFADATKWCDEGRRRFPAEARFVECRLWMMLAPDATPDIPLAWRRAATLDSLTRPDQRAFNSRLGQMIVGGVIGRASQRGSAGATATALADSADRVLTRARADRDVDPRLELAAYEAIMRAQMGRAREAIDLLRRYVAVNPDHSFEVGGNIHWWWRNLKNDPAFQAVMARR